MHPYRQNHPKRHSNPATQKYFSNIKKQQLPSSSTFKLASLITQFQANNIRISCNKKLTIIIQKNIERKHPALLSERKRKRKIGIYADGSAVTLQNCLQKYTSDNEQQYILTATPHHNYESMRPRGKSFSTKTRTNSETSIGKQHISKKNIERPSNFFSEQCMEGSDAQFKKLQAFGSLKKIADERSMFTVQQITGESMQSERQSLQRKENNTGKQEKQEMLKQEIKSNLNNITTKYLQQIGQNQLNEDKKTLIAKTSPKQSLIQVHKQASTQKENIDQTNQNEKNYRKQIDPQPHKTGNPKFSFSEMMKNGIIHHQSIKIAKQESFKLAGDEEIQAHKRMAKEIFFANNQMSDISQLSSIISFHQRQQIKKNLQLDSIKNEIEKITNCQPEISKHTQDSQTIIKNQQSQRIGINIFGQQHMNNASNLLQVSQRPLMQPNQSEYFVRYNLSDKKGLQNNVIRISPLKFRRKDEVVKHLVSAKIVFRESNSINIP